MEGAEWRDTCSLEAATGSDLKATFRLADKVMFEAKESRKGS